MKVILSRKGFDSASGGFPSPILPNGKLLSLPIPDETTGIKYSELYYGDKSYYEIMNELKPHYLKKSGKKIEINQNTTCHLDPDIYFDIYNRKKGWKGIFGQINGHQTHLKNQGVDVGDLFLYFGWFRKTLEKDGKLIFDPQDSKGRHIIYGYLQVEKIIQADNDVKFKDWMSYHPHSLKCRQIRKANTVYIASDALSWDEQKNGYGTFNYCDDLVLTKEGRNRSEWRLPNCFRNVEISYHNESSWKNDYFKSVDRGQEFVIKDNQNIENWAKKLITKGTDKNESIKVFLKDILNVVKADSGKEVVNNIMNNALNYFKDTYGTPDKAPEEVIKFLYIMGETAKNIENDCNEMLKGKFDKNINIDDIIIEIPRNKIIDM